MNSKFHAPFQEGMFYHVYNRTNDKSLLFRCKENYYFFLQRYHFYLDEYVDHLAYCLMPTHFHFLIRVKDGVTIQIEERFRCLFISYVKALNKMIDRHGNLLQRPFNRTMIKTEHQLLSTICYIHHNPIHHGYCNAYGDWEFCSYRNWFSSLGKGNYLPLHVRELFPNENWSLLHQEFYQAYRCGLEEFNELDLKFELDALRKREF